MKLTAPTKQVTMNPQCIVFRDGPNKNDRERDTFRELAMRRASDMATQRAQLTVRTKRKRKT